MTPTRTPWPPPSPQRVGPPIERRSSPAPDDRRLPAVAWVAAVGAVLVLAAASVLVVGNWNEIRPEIKLAGLVAVNLAVAAIAEALRSFLPVVSRALAHLAATMAVPSGVAALAAAGRPWPEAVLAGGAVGVAACAAQSRRWSAPLLVPAAEAAAVLGLAGVAALTGAPLGLLVAALAAVALAGRHEAGALRLAALAPTVPLLAVLGALGVGAGTAARLGARGDVLAWAAPAAGLAAAVVLAVVAQRRRAVSLTVASLLAALAGVGTGLFEAKPGAVVVLGLGGAALVAVAVMAERASGVWEPLARSVGQVAAWVALAAGPMGLIVAIAAGPSSDRDGALGLAVAAWTAAAVAFAFGGRPTAPPAPFGRPPTAWTGATPPEAALRVAGALSLAGAAAAVAGGALAGLVVFAVVAVVIGLRARPTAAQRLVWTAGLAPLAWVTAPTGFAAWAVLGAVGAASAALVATVRGPATSTAASSVVAGVAALAGSAVAPVWPAHGWAVAVGWGLVTGVAVAGRRWLLVGAVAPWFALFGADALGVGTGTMAVAAMVAAVALTGMAMTSVRPGPLDVAAVATATAGLVASFGYPGGALTSTAGVLLGLQGWLYGALRRQRGLALVGRVVAVASLVSLVSTSGLAAWVVDTLRPLGIDPVDVSVLLVSIGFLAGGWWLRRTQPPSSVGSWPAYAPGLLVGGAHLVTSQAATGQVWRAAVAIGVGVVAVAVGGLRRLGAPLVLGTLLIAVAAVVAGGARLAELPVWLWLAVGGVALLVVAVLIERGGPKAEAEHPAEWFRAVWHHFD